MNKFLILAAVLASGCADFSARSAHNADPDPVAAAAPAASCRMGAVPVCTRTTGSDDRPVLNCKCAYVPASLTGRETFSMRGFRRRR